MQREGVSMGNPLGPTFANFYMCGLENSVLLDNQNLKLPLYVRYVDDICLIVNRFSDVEILKRSFERNSVLKFTFETEIKKKMPFLDIMISRNQNSLSTSIFTKSTNSGDCINFESCCPDRYKLGLIKSILHRAYAICSNWNEISREIDRLKQLFTNNNYPLSVVESVIHKFISEKVTSSDNSTVSKPDSIELYFKNQMTLNYKQDEKQLKTILSKNLKPIDSNKKIRLVIYYKSKKLKNLFIKNNVHSKNRETGQQHHCVYQYSCSRDGCNSTQTYIGYTTCTIFNRFKMHTQNSSSIKKDLSDLHQKNKISAADLILNTKILKSVPCKRELLITEALYIKSLKPSLNSQTEFSDRILKIFTH